MSPRVSSQPDALPISVTRLTSFFPGRLRDEEMLLGSFDGDATGPVIGNWIRHAAIGDPASQLRP